MSNFVQNKTNEKIMLPMVIYAQILYIMCGSYFFRYEKTSFSSFLLMIIGVVSFAASDSMIAVEMLLKIDSFYLAFLINITYYLA